MAWDRADWHYGDDFPAGLPPENGGTHIGMFLAWAVLNGRVGAFHLENNRGALAAVRARAMTGRDFLFEACDEKLWEADLDEEGNAFCRDYYRRDDGDSYLADYEETLGAGLPSLYHVADTWENYDRMAAVVSRRYAAWKKARQPRRWWQVWKRRRGAVDWT